MCAKRCEFRVEWWGLCVEGRFLCAEVWGFNVQKCGISPQRDGVSVCKSEVLVWVCILCVDG